jgi:lipopolysaccharide heptosyltransferase II
VSRGWRQYARRTADGTAAVLFGSLGLASYLGRGGRPPRFEPTAVRRILVIRLDLLGDLVFSAPAIQALRAAYPQAELTLLTLPYTRPLAALIPGVDRVLALDVNQYRRLAGWRRLDEAVGLVRVLRAARFDLCVALHGRPAGVFALLSGARYRVGYAAHAYPFAFTSPVAGRRYARRQHEVDYCLDLARVVGADGDAIPRLRPPPLAPRPPALAGDAPYVVIHPGASNGAAKRWPAAAWARVARQAVDELGARVGVSGSEGERALVEAVVAAAGPGVVPVVGGSLLDLASLLAGAEAVLAGDTGPLHLAAALGRPVVGVYGPTDPAQTGPRSARAAVVRRPVVCGPCYDLTAPADCKLPDRATVCMRDLDADAVMLALRRLLRASSAEEVPLGAPGRLGKGAI